MKINYGRLSIILFASLVFGLSYNFLSPAGISLIGKKPSFETVPDSVLFDQNNDLPELPETEAGSKTGVNNIELHQAYKLFQSESAIFIDARDEWEFADGHIKGALNIPEYRFEPETDPVIPTLDKNAVIVVYCSGDDCLMSKKLGDQLSALGFKNIFVFMGGWIEWQEASYPAEKGEI